MAYPNEEKETTCVYDYELDEWNIYTCVPKHLTKLRKIAAPYWQEEEGGRVIAAKWKLKEKQVRFANEVNLSDEQRAERAEQARQRFKS